MAKNTTRDMVWSAALEAALEGDSFTLQQFKDVYLSLNDPPSDRTIRDTLNTMVELGWLRKDSPKAHRWFPGSIPSRYTKRPDRDDNTGVDVSELQPADRPE